MLPFGSPPDHVAPKENPVAVVTGGSTGIGEEICRHLLDDGFRVVSLALQPPTWVHPRLDAFTVDFTDTAATIAVARDVAMRFSPTHIIHNAGSARPNLLEQATIADFEILTRLHLGAALHLVQASLPAMKRRRFGRVILISSRAALGTRTRSAYSATKAGMIALARTWALELAPFGTTVNAVAPGPIEDTEMFNRIVTDRAQAAAIAKSIPVGRLGKRDDVARAVMFFADARNGFVTGQTLFVCGGATIGTAAV